MKPYVRNFARFAALGASLLAATAAQATSFTFQSENKVTLLDSAGAAVPFIETVAFGTFSTGFTPGESNLSSWADHWTTGENSEGGNDGNAWAAGFTLNEASAIGAGAQLYLWVTFDNAATDQVETLLLTDSLWVTVVSSSFDFSSYDYDFGAGTTALFGSLDVSGGIAQLGGASAVPEPAAYGALFGLGALVFAHARRRGRRS